MTTPRPWRHRCARWRPRSCDERHCSSASACSTSVAGPGLRPPLRTLPAPGGWPRRRARNDRHRTRRSGVDFQVGDFNALPFEDGAFDAIISSHALLFADDRTAALREWRRVSRSGGRLSLSVPAPRTAPRHPVRRSTASTVARTFDTPRPPNLRMGARCRMDRCSCRSGSSVAIRLPDADAFAIAPHRLAGCSDRGLERGAARGPPRTCWRSRPGSLTEPTPSVRAIYLIARN